MLVQITDHKGKEYWINPLYVRMVTPKGEDQCEIQGLATSLGTHIRVKAPAADVAAQISAAMPDSPAWQAIASTTAAEAQQASNAATISAITG